MGGGYWRENGDDSYTLLDDSWIVPASGFSYLDLYLMGLVSAQEVPDFFKLEDLQLIEYDSAGRPTYEAGKIIIAIDDVIAANGARTPPAGEAQTAFNIGFVYLLAPGSAPNPC